MDSIHDQLYDGRRIRILTIIDTFTRYVPAMEVRERFPGVDVVAVLEKVCRKAGFPRSIRVDQEPELISKGLDLWAYARDVELDFSRPGKPTDNAFIESLNDKFRANCLSAHWFLGIADARRKFERWRRVYNDIRPHSAIGYPTPSALVQRTSATSPP